MISGPEYFSFHQRGLFPVPNHVPRQSVSTVLFELCEVTFLDAVHACPNGAEDWTASMVLICKLPSSEVTLFFSSRHTETHFPGKYLADQRAS